MSQFLKDLGLKLKSDRKTQVIAGLALIAVVFLAFSENTPRRARAPRLTETSSGSGNVDERWVDLVARFDTQLKTQAQQLNTLQSEQENQRKMMQDLEATTAEIFKKVLERLAEIQAGPASQTANLTPKDVGDITGPDIVPVADDELDSINGGDPIAVAPPPPPSKPKLAAIMPGDSVRVKLLAGVNAPTDGTPYPVVLKLLGPVMGPDGNTIPLGEARLIAAAQGSLTDSRVLFRLTRLSLRLPNGRRKEFGIDGWIVGEDGIRGLSGVLIDPIGKAIGGAGMAGALAGLGQGIAAANQQYTLYSNGTGSSNVDASQIPAFAGGVALSSAAGEWQQLIRDRVSQLVPVVQVLSNREATAVFSQSLPIPDLLEALDEENPSLVYTSLD